MMALLVRPAISELGGFKPGTHAFNLWVGLLFYVPNVAAGVFGLLCGYFADIFGRKRILVWSILLYGLSACAAGFSTSLSQLLFFRCATLIGVSVELKLPRCGSLNSLRSPDGANPYSRTRRPFTLSGESRSRALIIWP